MNRLLFICDWDYTLFWTEVVRILRARGEVREAAALVVGRIYYDRLKGEAPEVFDRAYLLQDATERIPDAIPDLDARLARLEETYGNLWRFVWADRSWSRASYEEARKRLVICFDFFEELYRREEPEMILTNAFGSMPHLVAFAVAREMGIPMLRPLSLRLEDRYVLSKSAYEEEPGMERYLRGAEEPSPALRAEVEEFLARFRRDVPKPLYQKLLADRHRVTAGHFYRFGRYMYRYWVARSFASDHTKLSPLVRLWREAEWRASRKWYRRPANWDAFVPEERYVYFPLHVQPEASTMTNAPFYLDQLYVIETLSKSLPVGYRLVVKEHPSMLGRRDGSYYARLRSLPNVRLVDPHADSAQVIRNAELIFTITGTTSLEALLLKKPVITLGAIYWANHCPLVIRAGEVAPTGWPELVRQALEEHEHDDEILVRFLCGAFAGSFHGNFVEPLAAPQVILSAENLEPLLQQIALEYRARVGELAAHGATG